MERTEIKFMSFLEGHFAPVLRLAFRYDLGVFDDKFAVNISLQERKREMSII